MPVYGLPAGAVNQGDVRLNVSFFIRQDQGAEFVSSPGLIMSHSCDIDKYDEVKHQLNGNQKKRFPIQVAPLFGLGHLDASQAGDVRAGRHRRYFYLPQEAPHHEMVADLWLTQPVPLLSVRRLTRAATLSEEYLARLWVHAFVTHSRKDPRDVFVGGQLAP